MCHLLLLLPLVALPVFWLWPPSISVPVYAAVLVFSGLVYAALMRAMQRPVETGHEALLRARGIVESDAGEPLAVRIGSERWSAWSSDKTLRRGDEVCVIGMEGLVLRIARRRTGADEVQE